MKFIRDEAKVGLFSFGYVENYDELLPLLTEWAGEEVTESEMIHRVEEAYKNGDEKNGYYDEAGQLRIGSFNPKRTCRYAIYTGWTSSRYPGEKIYAAFIKDGHNLWRGVNLITESKIYNSWNAYYMGRISFPNYQLANEFIINLESFLLPGETWRFRNSIPTYYRIKTKYNILESYLSHTLKKLLEEHADQDSLNYKKIIFCENNSKALFNTGLLDKHARDIFLVGTIYNRSGNFFTFSNPKIAPGRRELIEKHHFSHDFKEPEMVEYFTSIDDLVYNPDYEIDFSDPERLKHIIKDGVNRNRFPEAYKTLFEQGNLSIIATSLENATKNARKIAKRNYKYVVPQYRPPKRKDEEGSIQFLMPIYLENNFNENPDFALVLNLDKYGDDSFYTPETILELAWAYNNARLLCKPDDTWLNPEKIDDTDSNEEELDSLTAF